eukprot:365673-Chlamydomonas_euryale.AAC.8
MGTLLDTCPAWKHAPWHAGGSNLFSGMLKTRVQWHFGDSWPGALQEIMDVRHDCPPYGVPAPQMANKR